MEKTGLVKANKQKDNMYFILMDEETSPLVEGKREAWFSGFGNSPEKFDKIRFNWEWNDDVEKKYRNIKGEYEIIEKGTLTKGKEDFVQQMVPKPVAASHQDTRNETIKFMNECIQDTFEIFRGRTESERGYMPDFMALVDQVRRTRIMKEIGKND